MRRYNNKCCIFLAKIITLVQEEKSVTKGYFIDLLYTQA